MNASEVRAIQRAYPQIFRALSKLVFGHASSVERYLADLRRKQGSG